MNSRKPRIRRLKSRNDIVENNNENAQERLPFQQCDRGRGNGRGIGRGRAERGNHSQNRSRGFLQHSRRYEEDIPNRFDDRTYHSNNEHRERNNENDFQGQRQGQGRGRGRGRGRDRGRGQEQGRRVGHNERDREDGGNGESRGRGGRDGRVPYIRLKEWTEVQDMSDLLIRLTGNRDNIKHLLDSKTLNEDWIYLLLNVFYKVSQMQQSQAKVALLALLCNSQFILQHLPNQLLMWEVNDQENVSGDVKVWLLSLIETYFNLFPSSCSDMPLDMLRNIIPDDDNEAVKRANELQNTRMELMKKTLLTERKNTNIAQFTDDPPPEDFHDIPTTPDVNDIHRLDKPYLRPIISRGGYTDGEQYLDVQFRLLREDLTAPLREGVREIIDGIPKNECKHGLKVYNGVRLLYPLCTKNGMIYRLQFDTVNTKDIQWQHSRRLIHGSLLCLSKDGFQSIVFATVANREAKNLCDGIIDVRFVGGIEAVEYFTTIGKIDMIESSAYFEAYKHVLEGMKQLDPQNIPLSSYIVHCKSDVDPPKYLKNELKAEYELKTSLDLTKGKSRFEVLHETAWPNYKKTSLNKSQLEAFRHALTKEFVVIQGPPGTGKTHVGLKIADALLINKKVWNKDNKTPLLVVCYTNHALDQFVRGLIGAGHTNVIRVGGRASEDMSPYSLFDSIKKMKENDSEKKLFQHTRRAKGLELGKRDETITFIDMLLQHMVKIQTKCMKGQLVHFNDIRDLMNQRHVMYFQYLDDHCRRIKASVFELYLQILNVHPEDIARYELIEVDMQKEEERQKIEIENEHNTQESLEEPNIDIEGEGEALEDRFVSDKDEFKEVTYNKRKDQKDDAIRKKGKKYKDILRDQDGFTLVQPTRKEKNIKIQKNFRSYQPMTFEEADAIEDPWSLQLHDRWRLYKSWLHKFEIFHYMQGVEQFHRLEEACQRVREIQDKEDEIALKQADIIAMTTTCAARCRSIIEQIQPKIVIIEEAAEVLEAHVLTSLNSGIEHLILIGDHQQLKPSPETYELATKYGLELSLFERMVNNGMQCHTLDIQHRMQPNISKLLRNIYPNLRDHPSVRNPPNIKGLSKNLVFIKHTHPEAEDRHLKSKSNAHEAEFIRSLCFYLLQQGYEPQKITILTGYTGQLLKLKSLMPQSKFRGVRVTSVDNYQGEENEIILLSLVRSNSSGNIGFMRTDNRICVALSRAKHGLYVVGNFDMLQQKSELWTKIVTDVDEMGCLQTSLEIYCQNHPDTRISAFHATDFNKAPEGGCTRPCEARLNCGHVCRMVCHPRDPDHLEYVCKRKCDKVTCTDKHRCGKVCHYGENCGPCNTIVQKYIVKCGHIQSMECHKNPDEVSCLASCETILQCGHACKQFCFRNCLDFKCKELVLKQLLCSHEQLVECYLEVAEAKCKTPCRIELDCGHICSGTCSRCKHGRLHTKCTSKCERSLICSHLCKQPCIRDCPPCSQKCNNRCIHSVCQKKCGELCVPCEEPCPWSCKHERCTKKCGEFCNRNPCNEPCENLISCDHPCVGVCGEPCPKLCRICDAQELQEIFFGREDEDDARFLVLEDCGHVLEVTGLDAWMEVNFSDDENMSIKLKECPKCKTVIRKSVRYGNIVKRTLCDINEVKKKIICDSDSKTELKQIKEKTYQTLKKINTIIIDVLKQDSFKRQRNALTTLGFVVSVKLTQCDTLDDFSGKKKEKKTHVKYDRKDDYQQENVASKFARRLLPDLLSYQEASNLYQQVQLIKEVWKIKKDILNNKHLSNDKTTLLSNKDLIDLEEFLRCFNPTPQQLKESGVELGRIRLYARIIICLKAVSNVDTTDRIHDKRQLSKCQKYLENPQKRSHNGLKDVENFVEKLENKYCVNGLSEELKIEIVNAMKLGKGHWFKCPNGHYYAIGECGGAMQTGKCPDCGATVGGLSHSLESGNQHAAEFDGSDHAAYSEEANNMLNLDPEQLRQLRL